MKQMDERSLKKTRTNIYIYISKGRLNVIIDVYFIYRSIMLTKRKKKRKKKRKNDKREFCVTHTLLILKVKLVTKIK